MNREQLISIIDDAVNREDDSYTFYKDAAEDYNLSQDIDRPRMTTEMDFRDAIKLAIKREEEAMQLYADIANSCIDKSEKDIFAGLSKMEKLHKTELEEIFLNVGFNEVW